MIKLIRTACPDPNALKTDYSNKTNKLALFDSTHNKCMYCESELKSIEYADVEHFKPKSKYPNLKFDWNNLGISCEICNRTYKSECDDNRLINPYDEDPEDYLSMVGGFIVAKSNNQRGAFSIQILGLNRLELLENRTKSLQTLNLLLISITNENDPNLKRCLCNQVKEAIKETEEFSFVKRKFVEGFCNETNITL